MNDRRTSHGSIRPFTPHPSFHFSGFATLINTGEESGGGT